MGYIRAAYPNIASLQVEATVAIMGEKPEATFHFDLDNEPTSVACPNCGQGEIDIRAAVLEGLELANEEWVARKLCDGMESIGTSSRKCLFRAKITVTAEYTDA